jgi:hypothetical protein
MAQLLINGLVRGYLDSSQREPSWPGTATGSTWECMDGSGDETGDRGAR